MKREANISPGHEKLVRLLLMRIDINATQRSIMKFLDGLKNPKDEQHQWVGTWNMYVGILKRFFKWRRNKCMNGINKIKRKEVSVYKPTDLWTQEDDLIFLKYCPSKRDRFYHMLARDLSSRVSEALGIKRKDVVFQTINGRQYAEVHVSGKTGSRTLPLINCLPYLKDYMNDTNSDPNAYLIRSKKLGRMRSRSMYNTYMRYQKVYFPKLLKDESIPEEDKIAISKLLRKPWNPYLVGRHTSLTQKSKILKESVLRQHAGWTPRSFMPEKYIHYFSNESSKSLLEAYGIVDKEVEIDKLKPKICSNCNEPNKIDAKFCVKCPMVLSYDAWEEAKQVVDMDIVEKLSKRLEALEATIN